MDQQRECSPRLLDRWEPLMSEPRGWGWGRTRIHDGHLCHEVGYEQRTGCLFRLPGTVPVRISVDFTRLAGQADTVLQFGAVDAERISGYRVQYNYYYGRFALYKKVGTRWDHWVEVEETRTPQAWDTMAHRHELIIGDAGRVTFLEDAQERITWQDPSGMAVGTEVCPFFEAQALGYGGAQAHTHWGNLRIASPGRMGKQEIVEDFGSYPEHASLDQWLPGVIGVSRGMEQIARLVERVKGTEATVLLTGETGTGKDLLARTIHEQGRRRDGPCVAVNCAAIPNDLVESELFGHTKGAFTGATAEKAGLFEAADGGTLFLNEIAELGLHVQAKLLQVLDTRESRRVGETRVRRTNVRIIAATSTNVADEVAAGRFRPELYYRLDMVRIHLPPLRERREDIPFLVSHLLREASGRLAKPVHWFMREAGALLLDYDWPGNVREFQHEIERRVVLLGDDGVIRPEDLSGAIRGMPDASGPTKACARTLPEVSLSQAMAQHKRRLVEEALRECSGNVTQAAKRLGVTRQNLQWIMRQLGVRKGVVENA